MDLPNAVHATCLGFPRMGPNRELKRLVESYLSQKIRDQALSLGASKHRLELLQLQKSLGLDHIPSNTFSLYDHVGLDTSFLVGAIPRRFRALEPSPGFRSYFAFARGIQEHGVDLVSGEMKKFFDSNYHYIVPEIDVDQDYKLSSDPKPLQEFLEAKQAGIHTRPVIIGPITFLLLAKPGKGAPAEFNPLSTLERLLPIYESILARLFDAGATWVQLDEPCLALDLPSHVLDVYTQTYRHLKSVFRDHPAFKLMVATYFGEISALDTVMSLDVDALHIDLVRGAGPGFLPRVLAHPKILQSNLILSLGLIDGRNIWKSDLSTCIKLVRSAVNVLGPNRVWVAPSSSLIFVPHSLDDETALDPEIKDWLAFAVEKIKEVVTIAKAINGDDVSSEIEANSESMERKRISSRIHIQEVKDQLSNVSPDMLARKSPASIRRVIQQEVLRLPLFPTSTVGSFPQTNELRVARAAYLRGEKTQQEYDAFIQSEIRKCIEFQEDAELDVLVHGEAERTDMVEFFANFLDGFVFTKNGWVQSYGTRCVKPPIIFGDVRRRQPMTVDIAKYAQSLTKKPVKGMLTGPITIMQWSFVRVDQPRKLTANQIALAILDEVRDLEAAGIKVIQIDEPAIREGLPLREGKEEYLKWAVEAFRLCSSKVLDATQIHSHLCYSEFSSVISSIAAMDVDVLSIESAKAEIELLKAFAVLKNKKDATCLAPGLFDIHSPRIPTVQEMYERLKEVLQFVDTDKIWIGPDCGLKTRKWAEVEPALRNMVQVAKIARQSHAGL